MLKIIVKTDKCKLEGKFPKEDMDDLLSAYVTGYQFSPQFRNKRKDGSRIWDGKMHLFSRITNCFPTGMLNLVCEYLDKSSILYELEFLFDRNLRKWEIPEIVGPYKLRDYQTKAIEAFFNQNRPLPYRGILKCVTGSGKSLMGATIAKIVDSKTIFLVHGKNLKNQNLIVFEKIFQDQPEKIGTIDASTWNPKQITVASVDTLYARIKSGKFEKELDDLFEGVTLLICDEAHRSSSKSFADVIRACNPQMRLGLSGTPSKKEDDRDLLLHSLTGPVIFEVGAEELVPTGAISKAELNCIFLTKPRLFELDWKEAYDYLIVNNPYRNKMVAKLAANKILENKQIIILAGNSIKLTHNIYNELIKISDQSLIKRLDGISKKETKDEKSETDQALDDFRLGKISCLISTVILDEGIDIPECNVGIMAGGGKSYNKVIQRVGRILRPKADGSVAEIYDIMDVTNPYLEKHCEARLRYYEEEKLFQTTIPRKATDYLKEEENGNSSELVGIIGNN